MTGRSNVTLLIGEIIEVSTLAFTAQCLEDPRPCSPRLFDPPNFGSFVKIQAGQPDSSDVILVLDDSEEVDPFAQPSRSIQSAETWLSPDAVFALVRFARSGSLDPSRRSSALGYPNEEDLLAHQPQLSELLTTEFSGLLIAYTDGAGKLRRHLPPRPPKIHSRVLGCLDEEVRALTDDLDFLRPVLSASSGTASGSGVSPDELPAAALRCAWEAHGYDQAYLLNAGKKLLELLGDDYDRLQAILRGVL